MVNLPVASTADKEREPKIVPVVETGEVPVSQTEKEAREEGYLERVEKEKVELKTPIIHQGKVLVTAPSAQKPKIVLPVSKQTYFDPKNWHLPVTAALRWLLAWIKRVIKMYPGGTAFQDEPIS